MTDKPTDVPPGYTVYEDVDGDLFVLITNHLYYDTREEAVAACHAHRAAVTAEAVAEELQALADALITDAFATEPETSDALMQASREGYREGLKWAAKKVRWSADGIDARAKVGQ